MGFSWAFGCLDNIHISFQHSLLESVLGLVGVVHMGSVVHMVSVVYMVSVVHLV